MSSNRINLTRTSPLEQRKRQENDLQYQADAGRGRRETSHRSESHASNNRGDPRAARYHQASVHDIPEADEDEEAVLNMPQHYQGPPTVSDGAHGGGRLSIPSPRREEPAMSSAGYGRQGASAYDGRGSGHAKHTPSHLEPTMSSAGYGRQGASAYGGRSGGYGKNTPSHLDSTMSSASMMSEDSHGYAGRAPQGTANPESYGGGYGGIPPHLEQSQMSGAPSTTSNIVYEDPRWAAFERNAMYGYYPAPPRLYDPVETDKLMDERAGRTRPGPYPGYPQRYVESVEAAMRDLAINSPYQAESQILRGGASMTSGIKHGGPGGQPLPRLPNYARSNERFDGDIQGQQSVPQGTSFARTRSRAPDMHPHPQRSVPQGTSVVKTRTRAPDMHPHPHSPRLERQRRSEPRETVDDIMERFDLGDRRRSRHDSRSRH